MKHKFFNIKELKESLTKNNEESHEVFYDVADLLFKTLQNLKNPALKKESGFFSYKGSKINLN